MKKKEGLILIFTGDGKGKTTAALGTALRAAGHGLKSIIIQFIKGTWKYGELKAIKFLNEYIKIYPMGKGYIFKTDSIEKRTEHRKVALDAIDFARKIMLEEDLKHLILDEINNVVSLGIISPAEVISLLDSKPKHLNIILTGRDAHPDLIDRADLVTEMKEVKHYYRNGIKARKGLEF